MITASVATVATTKSAVLMQKRVRRHDVQCNPETFSDRGVFAVDETAREEVSAEMSTVREREKEPKCPDPPQGRLVR